MFTLDDLRHGLEWIEGKTKITVDYDGSYLDIVLYPDYPNEKRNITLFIGVNEVSGKVRITDLVGNGYSTGYQNHGYGILIFNIGIQALHILFNTELGAATTKTITITGGVSNSGDPENEPERSQCRDRRNGFWMDYGFKLSDPLGFKTSMKANLNDLRLRTGKPTPNGTPRLVALNQFWRKGSSPSLFLSDIEKLASLNFDQFNLHLCPSRQDVDRAFNNSLRSLRYVERLLLISSSIGCIYLGFYYFDPFNAATFSLGGIFCSYLLVLTIGSRLWRYFPSYKKYTALSESRGNTRSKTKAYIWQIEESCNGLLWRLHQHLQSYSAFKNDTFNALANASKKQETSVLVDHYREYIRYMNVAKNNILNSETKYN